jgi:hypothetical protein
VVSLAVAAGKVARARETARDCNIGQFDLVVAEAACRVTAGPIASGSNPSARKQFMSAIENLISFRSLTGNHLTLCLVVGIPIRAK